MPRITVSVRLRPDEANRYPGLSCHNDSGAIDYSISGTKHDFAFDKLHSEGATQDMIFSSCQSHIDQVVDGFNSTIFAYGQTGGNK